MAQLAKSFMLRIRPAIWIAIALGALTLTISDTQAHKAVTSPFDFNKDVFPLLRDHCSRCHADGGPAPMSLTTFKDAVPWAESIRDELTARRMPPWPVDPLSPAVKGGYPISALELDKIVTWASGGTPHGDLEKVLPLVTFSEQWKLGPPDLKIQMESEHNVPVGTLEETAELSLPSGLTEEKWVKAVDLVPGAPTMVRDAIISVENGPVLALWQPGNDAIAAPSGAAFKLPAGAKLHLQMHYKKHYTDEQNALKDRSTVGLYFTDPPASGRELQAQTIDGPKDTADMTAPATFDGSLKSAARIVALRPMIDQAYEMVEITAVTTTGRRIPLLKLHGERPQWFRRYWLQEPTELASGSKIEVKVTPLPASADELKSQKRFPLQLAFDYVPQ